jgi:hypothetical protein
MNPSNEKLKNTNKLHTHAIAENITHLGKVGSTALLVSYS